MNLLDKYLLEVGKYLPRKHRQDIQAEIRSTLEDMLDDRSRMSGKPVDDTLLSEVLQEYGAPAKVAESYNRPRYLIGPRLYPFFEMVVKIVLTVLVVVSLVGFGINAARSGGAGPEFLASLGSFFAQFFTGLISAFGNIVLVFAILERVLPAGSFEEKEKTWTPADLDAEPDPAEVKRSEPVFAIIFTAIGLVLFNLYPDLVGFSTIKEGVWISVPALSQAFFHYLPWINLLGISTILLEMYLLVKGSWQMTTRLAGLALDIGGIVLAVIMLAGPSLVNLETARMAEVFGESADVLTKLLNGVPYLVLVVLITIQSIEVAQAIWRMVKTPKPLGGFLPR